MSSKQQTNSSGSQNTAFQFNPQGMSNYNLFQRTLGQILPGFINNPFGNPQFQLEQSMGQANANQLGLRNMQNLMANSGAFGYGNMPGFMQAQQAAAQRGQTGLQAGAWRSSVLNALQRQQGAMGLAAAYQPLMTGSNMNYQGQQTQTTSGLGTWLPQLAGAAIGGAMNAFMPGSSALMGAAGGGGGGGGFSPSSLIPSNNAAAPGYGYTGASSIAANPFPLGSGGCVPGINC